ncbi:hypothetical protein [Parasphingopyxis lamellibrachiae]|uniref:Uncharacterized protein n=1 Tax=Parasphingopyxis lamellibrachiae TaxID=680125 RepID=A0A3D9FIT1_9SPHN|nr:hypothetical protein [Parasphingopyxis lamellibrachiae]RED16996.1 hypothetical protein DFR46_2030 [Parasphingopyxis lamellibrachiae]
MPTSLHLTRDSVAAGDDFDAPHSRTIKVERRIETPGALQECLDDIAAVYLPNVAGPACWAAYSHMPLAILSDAWSKSKPFWLPDGNFQHLDIRDGAIHLNFVYLALEDPETAHRIIGRIVRAGRG